MPTFGNEPADVVTNSRGDVLAGVVLSLYGSQADAVAGTNVLLSVTTDSLGRWSYTHVSLTLLWVRTPSGSVFSVTDPTLTAGAASAAAATADAKAVVADGKAVAAQGTADTGVANALTAQTQVNVNTAGLAANVSATGTAQSRADLGVANAATAQVRADLGVANALTAQSQVNVNTADIASKLASTDAQVVAAIAGPSASRTSLNAAFAAKPDASRGVSRVLTKLTTGQAIKVAFIGDSGLEGTTVTVPGTDDCASLVCATLGTRFGVAVTKSNRAVSGWKAYSPLDPSHASPTALTLALADQADLYVIGFGHNDARSGPSLSAAYLPGSGYALTSHLRALEHMVRRLRIERPGADIILSSEWQYTGASSGSNVDLAKFNDAAKRLASAYGCGFVDFWAALAELGVTGTTPAVDDLYIGTTTAQHPGTLGHGVWAETITDLLPAGAVPSPEAPAALPSPLFHAERYAHTPWLAMPVAASALRTYGTSGYRLVGTWAGTSVLPQTSTTAGDYAEFQFVGHELGMRFDGTAGHVKIEVDAGLYNADLNLAAQGAGQNFYCLDLGPGIHRVVVTVISGSVTFRGLDYAPSPGVYLPYTSAALTYTGTWITLGTEAKAFAGNAKQTTTASDTLTVEWVGTALWCAGSQYGSTTNSRGVATDGGTEAVADYGVAGGATQYAGWLVTSGLPYGRHTTVIRQVSGGRALVITGFLAFDEARHEHPSTIRGVTVTGESPAFPIALPGRPVVRLSPDDASSAVPGYASVVTAAGFTANGTAAARHLFEVETGRIAY